MVFEAKSFKDILEQRFQKTVFQNLKFRCDFKNKYS